MLYDTSIEETRCMNYMTTAEKQDSRRNKMYERERERNVESSIHRSLPVQNEVSSSGCEG